MIYYVKSIRICTQEGCDKPVVVMDKRRSIGYCGAHAPELWIHIAEENHDLLFAER